MLQAWIDCLREQHEQINHLSIKILTQNGNFSKSNNLNNIIQCVLELCPANITFYDFVFESVMKSVECMRVCIPVANGIPTLLH